MSHPLPETLLQDPFGRRFPYLRLSVTDVCNFRCGYCLPDGYTKSGNHQFLSPVEIQRLVTAFAALGTWKIRLTGGEPTLRQDFTTITHMLANVDGVERLAFTTNGYKLPERAQAFYDAGLRAINISIDSLDPARFASLTGHDRLQEVTTGVDAALEAGFEAVKINTVLLKGINDAALDDFIAFIAHRPVSLRFIELMQTGDNHAYFRDHHASASLIRDQLLVRGWVEQPRAIGAGPAIEFSHADYAGRIGLIAPYSKDFCASCNRLRVSARGELHLCLFGESGFDLRPLLQDDSQQEELQTRIMDALQFKRSGHFLHDGDTGIRQHFAAIGG